MAASISIDKDANAAREFLTQNGITYLNSWIRPNILEALSARVYSETLLITPDGEIARRIVGEQDWGSTAMLQLLEDVYQGRRDSRM